MIQNDFIMHVKDDKKVIFQRPFLNDEKKLVFLYCDSFSQFSNVEFVLDERKRALEIKHPDMTRRVYLLLKGNERMLKEAIQTKEEILNLLRDYTKRLRNGKEKVVLFLNKNTTYPYYFSTESILLHNDKSSKFVQGFLYFVNQHFKNSNIDFEFDSFDHMQKRLNEYFKEEDLTKFEKSKIDNTEVYTISFKDFLKLLH